MWGGRVEFLDALCTGLGARQGATAASAAAPVSASLGLAVQQCRVAEEALVQEVLKCSLSSNTSEPKASYTKNL